MEKRPLASSKLRAIRVSISFANSSNENSKLTDSVCGGRVRVIGGRYGDLRDQDGRASDGESNWVELHGLTSFSGNGLWIYAIGLLCAVLWRPLALPLRSSCMCSHFRNPSARRNVIVDDGHQKLSNPTPLFLYDEPFQAGRLELIFFIVQKKQRWRTRPIWAPVGRRSTPTTPTTKVRIYALHILFTFGADQFISHADSFV